MAMSGVPPVTPPALPRRAWEYAHSMKLALTLMLLCALVAVPGTLVPADQAQQLYRAAFGPRFLAVARAIGLLDTYRSPPFVTLVGLLAVNVALCSWRRLRVRRAHTARRGLLLICSDLVLHASVICILAGGVGKAIWGFTGTQYLFVGVETATVYDWSSRADVPLGFGLLARERVEEFYPFQLKVGIKDAAGRKIALLDLAEGRPAELPGGAMRVSLLGYDAEAGSAQLAADSGGRRVLASLSVREGSPAVPLGDYSAAPVAYRRELKGVRTRIAVLDGGREVKEEWLTTNDRLAYRETSVFQTGWGRDEFGNLYVGIQVSRDPAAPLFWAGCILFTLSSAMFLFLRQRRGRSD